MSDESFMTLSDGIAFKATTSLLQQLGRQG
jgi:hypothetical protein